MVLSKIDEQRIAELKKAEDELRKFQDKILALTREREELENKLNQLAQREKTRTEKAPLREEYVKGILQQLTKTMEENAKSKEENVFLQKERQKLIEALEDIEQVKQSRNKYKEMTAQMLQAMKQMDADMKELVKRTEEVQGQLKESLRKQRALQRKNETLGSEIEVLQVGFFS